MRKIITAYMIFAAVVILCSDVFAQRDVNNANEAAKAAKASLTNRPSRDSSQIDWLNNVINVINMDQLSSKDKPAKNKTSDK